MQNFFGVEVDTASMTTEELEKAEIEIRKMYANIKHQLSLRKSAEHKYSSTGSIPAEI